MATRNGLFRDPKMPDIPSSPFSNIPRLQYLIRENAVLSLAFLKAAIADLMKRGISGTVKALSSHYLKPLSSCFLILNGNLTGICLDNKIVSAILSANVDWHTQRNTS
jgi:hypothetical protein